MGSFGAARYAFIKGVRRDLRGEVHPTAVLEGAIYLAEGATVGPHAYIKGPVWIGEGAEVGHGAYVRNHAVLGPHTKVGHASEVKRSLLLEGAKAPHFNYVGDAVLGRGVNLGAGVKLANLKAVDGTVEVGETDTGLRKFSAAVGDEVSIGCNAVLSPGTLIGPRTVVYNGAMFTRGVPGRQCCEVAAERRADLSSLEVTWGVTTLQGLSAANLLA